MKAKQALVSISYLLCQVEDAQDYKKRSALVDIIDTICGEYREIESVTRDIDTNEIRIIFGDDEKDND